MSLTSTRLTCCLIKWWQSSKKFTEMQYTVVSLFVKLRNNYNFTGSHKKSSEESRFGKCPELQVGGQCRRDHLRDIFHVSLQSRRARQPLVSCCTILLPFLKRVTFSQELASRIKTRVLMLSHYFIIRGNSWNYVYNPGYRSISSLQRKQRYP